MTVEVLRNCFWVQVAYAQILPCDIMESTLNVDEDFNSKAAASFQHKVVLWHQQRKAASKRAQRAYLHLLHIYPHQGSVYGDLAMARKLDLCLDQDTAESISVRYAVATSCVQYDYPDWLRSWAKYLSFRCTRSSAGWTQKRLFYQDCAWTLQMQTSGSYLVSWHDTKLSSNMLSFRLYGWMPIIPILGLSLDRSYFFLHFILPI